MDLDDKLNLLYAKDTSEAFTALKELELLSDHSDVLYPYINRFIDMVHSEKYVIRVRGFRLFCKQAQWDTSGTVDKNLSDVLVILEDDKPTAVRQALAALQDVVLYKTELQGIIKERALAIHYLRYKDTMHSLIAKDIENLLSGMCGE